MPLCSGYDQPQGGGVCRWASSGCVWGPRSYAAAVARPFVSFASADTRVRKRTEVSGAGLEPPGETTLDMLGQSLASLSGNLVTRRVAGRNMGLTPSPLHPLLLASAGFDQTEHAIALRAAACRVAGSALDEPTCSQASVPRPTPMCWHVHPLCAAAGADALRLPDTPPHSVSATPLPPSPRTQSSWRNSVKCTEGGVDLGYSWGTTCCPPPPPPPSSRVKLALDEHVWGTGDGPQGTALAHSHNKRALVVMCPFGLRGVGACFPHVFPGSDPWARGGDALLSTRGPVGWGAGGHRDAEGYAGGRIQCDGRVVSRGFVSRG